MAASLLNAAMSKQWTPVASLSGDALKAAAQSLAAMDKDETTTTKPNNKAGATGLGSMLGMGAGLVASVIPGLQAFAPALIAAGGALGGGIEGGMSESGDWAGGAASGGLSGAAVGFMGPSLIGAEGWGGAQTAIQGGLGLGGEAAAGAATSAMPTLAAQATPEFLSATKGAGLTSEGLGLFGSTPTATTAEALSQGGGTLGSSLQGAGANGLGAGEWAGANGLAGFAPSADATIAQAGMGISKDLGAAAARKAQTGLMSSPEFKKLALTWGVPMALSMLKNGGGK